MYVSLAITHSENGDVEKALEYYRKELEIRKAAGFTKDFKEVCLHLSVFCLQVADVQLSYKKDCIEEYFYKIYPNGSTYWCNSFRLFCAHSKILKHV